MLPLTFVGSAESVIRRFSPYRSRISEYGSSLTDPLEITRSSRRAVSTISAQMPLPSIVGIVNVVSLVAAVQQQEQRLALDRPAAIVCLVRGVAVDEHAERMILGGLPVAIRHLLPVRPNPGQVLSAALDRWLAAKEVPAAQHGVGMPEVEALSREGEQLAPPVVELSPVDPRDLVVLRVRVVVAVLRPRDLVAMRQHRHALGEGERRDEVAHHPKARVENSLIGRVALDAPVAADVVVVAVAIVLAVRLVVLLLVAHEVVQRVAVVRRDEVDARVRAAPARLIDVARAGKPRRQLRNMPGIALPEVPHGISILPVPLRPANRESCRPDSRPGPRPTARRSA